MTQTSIPTVLFLCTGNSCRSQMAEGWAKQLHPERMRAYSAGTHPQSLNPHAVAVMAEVGVDISQQQAKHMDALHDVSFDVVVTVCGHANEHCPVFPGKVKRVHAGFEDPPELARALAQQGASEQAQLDCYREVRDAIKAFVEGLPAQLATMQTP